METKIEKKNTSAQRFEKTCLGKYRLRHSDAAQQGRNSCLSLPDTCPGGMDVHMRTVLPNHGVGLTCVPFAWGLLGVGSHVVVREFISYNGPHAYLRVLPTSSSYPLLAFSLFFSKFKGLKLHNSLLHTQLF